MFLRLVEINKIVPHTGTQVTYGSKHLLDLYIITPYGVMLCVLSVNNKVSVDKLLFWAEGYGPCTVPRHAA